MAIRTKLLNGNNITRDTDFSKFIQTVSEPGVIEGFTVTANSVAVGQARVPCERTNGETLYALIYNTAPVSISGNGEVYILVNQTYIDDGELANEDGTGIATIVVGTTPSKNALKLATITGGVVADNRHMIPKVGELETYIQSLNTRMNTAEQKIDELITDSAVDHLEETGLVGELYSLSDALFKQKTPALADCTVDVNIGDVDADKQIHIQRIASGVASNKLKLKVKKIGAPTTGLVVEVRRGVQVTVTENSEAYWYGNELVCSGSIAYSAIDTTYAEIEITMNGQFGGTKGELLDIVVYQTGNIVNSTNYYAMGCDSTQYSEAFSYVKVNGDTRERSKIMPYCIGDGFEQSLLCKTDSDPWYTEVEMTPLTTTITAGSYDVTANVFTASETGYYMITGYFYSPSGYQSSPYWATVGGGTVISTNGGAWMHNGGMDLYGFVYLTSGQTATITCSPGNHSVECNNIKVVLYRGYDIPHGDTFPVFPREIVEIGGQATTTLYGKDVTGRYVGGIMLGISTSATTGSVALGNAVGYITVNFNGNTYKIPYYDV